MLLKSLGVRTVLGTLAYTLHHQGVGIKDLVGTERTSVHVELRHDDDERLIALGADASWSSKAVDSASLRTRNVATVITKTDDLFRQTEEFISRQFAEYTHELDVGRLITAYSLAQFIGRLNR